MRQKEKELAQLTAVSAAEGRWRPPAPPRSPPPAHSRPRPAQVNEQLVSERSGLAEVLRKEFADRLAASEEESRQLRAELAELRARQRLELEQLTREKQAELEHVHGRWAAGVGGGVLLREPEGVRWGGVGPRGSNGRMWDLRKGSGLRVCPSPLTRSWDRGPPMWAPGGTGCPRRMGWLLPRAVSGGSGSCGGGVGTLGTQQWAAPPAPRTLLSFQRGGRGGGVLPHPSREPPSGL